MSFHEKVYLCAFPCTPSPLAVLSCLVVLECLISSYSRLSSVSLPPLLPADDNFLKHVGSISHTSSFHCSFRPLSSSPYLSLQPCLPFLLSSKLLPPA